MDIRTIAYHYHHDESKELHSADIVVGDGTIVYDCKYDEYDQRIMFYFHDEAEFLSAFEEHEDIGFTIVGVEAG